MQRHYLLAGIPSEYWTISVGDFFGDPEALTAAKEYLSNWKEHKWHGKGIRFYAPDLGVGKTTLATLVAKDLIKRGEPVQFISFFDAIGLYQMPYEQREIEIRKLRNVTVLVLDEVGVAYTDLQHSFYAAELESLIRARTSGKAVTIITTNMLNERLEEVYPRVFSLLAHRELSIHVGPLVPGKKGNNHPTDARQSGQIANEIRPIV